LSAELNHHGTHPEFRIRGFASAGLTAAGASSKTIPRLEELPGYTRINQGHQFRPVPDLVGYVDRPVLSYNPFRPVPAGGVRRHGALRPNRTIQENVATRPNLAFFNLWAAMLGPDGQPRECTLTTRVTLFA
jgi:hypothetical protein